MTTEKMNTTEQQNRAIASTFVRLLHEQLTREEWRKLGDLNFAETNPNVCHSHDFLDANMVMLDAFQFHEIDHRDHARWSAVWRLATPMMTRIPCPTVFPERSYHYGDGRIETQYHVACRGSLSTCTVCGARRFCGFEARCLDDAMPHHWKRMTFNIEGVYGEAGLAGWTKGERWNGWACPFFERAEALAIVNQNREDGSDIAEYDAATDTIRIRFEAGEEPADEWPGQDIETAEGTRHVYAVGAGYWTWDQDEIAAEVTQ